MARDSLSNFLAVNSLLKPIRPIIGLGAPATVASSVYAVNTGVFSADNTYGSTTFDPKYVLYCTAVQ